jgi:hypothetical protein
MKMRADGKPKKKSRRVRMAEAVRKEATATLLELGFRNPKKADPSRWPDGRLNTFLRWRGTDYDEVIFQWDKNNGAKFWVRFHCSRVEAPQTETARTKRWVWNGWLDPGGISAWFGPWHTINGVLRLLRRRLHALEGYFHDGMKRHHLRPGKPDSWTIDNWTSILPKEFAEMGDPWRDPEFDPAPSRRAKAKPAR